MKTSKKKAIRKKKAQAKSGAPIWLATITELGRVVNLKERRLYQLRHEGLPRKSPGVYDVVACCRWYVRFLQAKIAERANPPENASAAVGVTKNKILAIESEMKSIELAERRERLISVEKVQQDLHAIVREIRRRFAELPKKLAAEVVGVTDLAVSQVLIDRTLKSALAELSEFDPDEPVEAVAASAARSSTRSRIQ